MSRLTSVYRKARGAWFLLRNNAELARQADASLAIDIDIRRYLYARYFYSFVKFLRLEGHSVALRARPETVHLINRSQYANAVLSERLVSIGEASSGGRWLIADQGGQINLEPFDFKPSGDPSVVDIPMAQHPAMYSNGYWNQQVIPSPPKATILFLGNSSLDLYSRISVDGLFDVIDRVKLREIMQQIRVNTVADTGTKFGAEGPAIQMLDSSVSQVAMEDFRQVVSGFGFFLCAPGVFMPLCHNLVEAMSVGTVPVIQKAYSDLMVPPLTDGLNAVVFNDETHLLERVDEILNMPVTRVGELRDGVRGYYESHLTPRAVVAKVLSPGVRKIRMLAGDHSLDLLRRAHHHSGSFT